MNAAVARKEARRYIRLADYYRETHQMRDYHIALRRAKSFARVASRLDERIARSAVEIAKRALGGRHE